MPVVGSAPRYNQPQVQEAALPGVRVDTNAPIEAFGGGRANQALGAVSDLSNKVAKIALEERDKADDVSLAEQATKLKQWKIDRLYNEQSGALVQKGQNAFGLPETVGDEYNKFTEELMASAPNDRVRSKLTRFAQNEGLDINEKLQVHVGRERMQYDKDVTEGLVKTAQDDALVNFNDPARVEENLGLMRGAILKSAERNGIPGVEVDRMMTEQTGKVHSAIIERHLNSGDDRVAKAYFDKYGDQLTGSQKMSVEKALEAGMLRGESQRSSDAILKKYGENMGGALEEARKIEDPKLRDETLGQLKQNYADIKAAKSYQVENMHRNAANILDKTPDVSKIPASQWAQFSLSERASLKAYAKQRAEGDLNTNWGEYYNLKTMAAQPETRATFLKTNLFENYRTKMADPEFKELVNMQSELRKGDGKSQRELDGFLSTKEIVDGALRKADIDPSPKEGSGDAEKVFSFKNQVNTQLKEIEARTGKKPTSDEELKIVNGLLTEAVLKKRIFFLPNKKGKIFEAQPDDIPEEMRSKLEDTLRRNGRPVNDDTVTRLYQSTLKANPRGN